MPGKFAALHRPLGRFFRTRRLRRFAQVFELDSATTVLDLGGAEYYWQWCPVRPQVTVANLAERDLGRKRFPWVRADGRALPFADRSFDIVHCNSVLEHLPDERSRQAMASEIARVGCAYWVQTPNRWFPVEPHTFAPGFQFLPRRWRIRLARNFTVWGWLQRPSPEEARGFVENIRLLDEAELQRLFPTAAIERERCVGLVKSVTAVHQTPAAAR